MCITQLDFCTVCLQSAPSPAPRPLNMTRMSVQRILGCTASAMLTRGLHEDYTRPADVCFQPHPLRSLFSNMGLCISAASRRQTTGRLALCGECQWPGYASFSCYVYWLLSEHGTFAAVHILYQSTSSMTIPFSTSFISLGPFLWTKIASRTGYTTDGGGMRLLMFVEDGETSSLAQRPI